MTDEPSAPRPVPETAARCSFCGADHPDGACSSGFAPPAEPVEEAQRCRTCGHGESSHVENEDEWGYCNDCGPDFAGVHEFDAEDEGARPLTVERSTELSSGGTWFNVTLPTGGGWSEHVSHEVEAAIHKEAIAALRQRLAIAEANQDWLAQVVDAGGALDRLGEDRDEWRTRAEAAEHSAQTWRLGFEEQKALNALNYDRAEAAEGALRERAEREATYTQELARIRASGEDIYERYALLLEAARALTAESVTPTGEPQ